MKATHIWATQDENGIRFGGLISASDLINVKLDRFDRLMLNQPCMSAADAALDLHTLLFRIQQNTQAPAPGQEGGE